MAFWVIWEYLSLRPQFWSEILEKRGRELARNECLQRARYQKVTGAVRAGEGLWGVGRSNTASSETLSSRFREAWWYCRQVLRPEIGCGNQAWSEAHPLLP